MNENKSKRREWVKTAAIVFLSVLLVLTFFSSTIMNYSLPEVATQYVEPSNITAKVRGSGMVESGDPYSVRLKTSTDANATGVYDVKSVEVKKGDKVTSGDVLCQLAEGDNKYLQEANNKLESQLLEYEISVLQGEVSESVLEHVKNGSSTSMSTYEAKLAAKKSEIETLEAQVKEAENTLESWRTQQTAAPDVTAEKEALAKAQQAYDSVAAIVENADEKIRPFQAIIDENQAIVNKKNLLDSATGEPLVSDEEIEAAKQNISTMKAKIKKINTKEVQNARNSLDALKAELERAQEAYNDKASSDNAVAKDQINIWEKELIERKQKVDTANEEKDQMVKDMVTELRWKETVDELREEIASMEKETVGGEVKSPISGTIMDVNVKSGHETPDDGILFTIQPEGKGFTMQFSVSNEQAKRLSVGDYAELVNSWRYDDVEVRLASIKPDPTNPSQNKQLTFDVTGNVTAGQSLNVSVGEKSQNYELTVPNSAIREDNNGKFILIIETKSTPLNNRYIASRVDVEVLASDETRSAISAAIYGYEYVITTSTAPVEAGKQVRLANN